MNSNVPDEVVVDQEVLPPGDAAYAAFEFIPWSDQAKALIGDVALRLAAVEKRERARKPDDAESFQETLKRFIANLMALADDKKSGGWISRSMKQDSFTGNIVSYTAFKKLRDLMVSEGLIKHKKGYPRFGLSFDVEGAHQQFHGQAARFRTTDKLKALAEQHGIEFGSSIRRHFRVERWPVEARRSKTIMQSETGRYALQGERVRYKSTERTEILRRNIESLNEFLADYPLGDGDHETFFRQFNEFSTDAEYRWNKGGRLYSSTNSSDTSYQQLSGEARSQMTIDDEPVVEIDIGASYLTIFHSLVGKPLSFATDEDPYARIGAPRALAKTWLTAVFGLGSLIKKWSKGVSKAYFDRHGVRPKEIMSARTVCAAALNAYPALETVGKHGRTWADLMFIESEVIIGTMDHLARMDGVPSYPVHDSLIVPASEAETATMRLCENFHHKVGVVPIVRTKSALPGVSDLVEATRDAYFRDWKVEKPRYNPVHHDDPQMA